MIWDVNRDQNCKFISIRKFDGYFNKNFWININENQIALNSKNQYTDDFRNRLQLTSEENAISRIVNHTDLSMLRIVDQANKRTKRQSYVSTFQKAEEFQYLENNLENQLKHSPKTFCQMFNDHNNILKILLKNHRRKFVQSALNYLAIDVKMIKNDVNFVRKLIITWLSL